MTDQPIKPLSEDDLVDTTHHLNSSGLTEQIKTVRADRLRELFDKQIRMLIKLREWDSLDTKQKALIDTIRSDIEWRFAPLMPNVSDSETSQEEKK